LELGNILEVLPYIALMPNRVFGQI
jgi:hypothetical protein